MTPIETTQVIGSKRYSTATATLIADDGASLMLFRTPNGSYFTQRASDSGLSPLTRENAIELHRSMTTQWLAFEDAFPGVSIEDA